MPAHAIGIYCGGYLCNVQLPSRCLPPNRPLTIDHTKISIVNQGAVRRIVAVSNNAMLSRKQMCTASPVGGLQSRRLATSWSCESLAMQFSGKLAEVHAFMHWSMQSTLFAESEIC